MPITVVSSIAFIRGKAGIAQAWGQTLSKESTGTHTQDVLNCQVSQTSNRSFEHQRKNFAGLKPMGEYNTYK